MGILHVEILYYDHTSGSHAQQRPHLYKINQLLLAEMKISILMLLTNNAAELYDIPPISCEDKCSKYQISRQQLKIHTTSETAVFEPKINEPCIVIQDQSDGQKQYLSMYRQCVDATNFLLEHLELVRYVKTRRYWQYPLKEDEQITLIDQIILMNV